MSRPSVPPPPTAPPGPPGPPTAPPTAPPGPPTPPPTPPDSAPLPPTVGAPRRPGENADRTAPGPDAWPDPDARPAVAEPPTPPATAGTPVVCPHCRTENTPDRTLCVRCALLLDPGPPPAIRPPWWRRILSRGPRQSPVAGTRPRRGWRRPRIGLPIVLILLAVGIWFALPHLSGLFGVAKEETGKPESVPPTECRASGAAEGHPAGAAVDGFNNRYWAPKETGDGIGEFLECDFAQPVRLTKLIVFSGTSARKDEFLTQARPAGVTVLLTSRDGELTTRTIRLRDQAGEQTFDLRGSETVRARFTVNSAYGTGKDRRIAVAEVEFFGRRS
ncbi:NADase-type glycan-binding domain-containing protein [Streptomyces sp. NPDC060366]|uniref:discoidin domain-containing protein n=1 Tax=Streptomyces sp. NPDC060366 TaxID=3347105 RepID=UPI003661F10A